MSVFVEVVLGLPVDKPFDYSVPKKYQDQVAAGKRVWVPFGSRKLVGYITGVKDRAGTPNLKDIFEVIDAEPMLDEKMMELSKWMSKYYMCSLGEAVHNTVPGVLKKGKTEIRQRKFEQEDIFEQTRSLTLTQEQDNAFRIIGKDLDENKFEVFLLHGITSSGKTEVYLQLIDRALRQGKSSIVLVPEISLTPQTIERFKSRFGDMVAVMHSRLLGSKRYQEFKRIKEGTARVVVGARSAIFSPVRNLGIVVIDEEQEPSYKQEDNPRYHAREVAIKRAELSNAIVVLGTATPSMESYYMALRGEYKLLELNKRIDNRPLPVVHIIDMKEEMTRHKRPTVLSDILKRKITEVLAKGEQIMLFLNRRGFATYITCTRCGYSVKCKRCDIVLVYHSSLGALVCHNCGYKMVPPNICPECQGADLRYFGKGTEKVESELHRLFPQARIDRMDTDATKKRGSHDRILKDFKEKRLNILVGTQMIAKGHDFPEVTLVGVISSDVTLNLADFRASERTFNLLMQVGGRSGRGEEPGEVVIQTYTPDHYAIKSSKEHDYRGFYEKEMISRKELSFPPFMHIIKITCRGTKEEYIIEALEGLKAAISAKKIKGLYVQGPMPSIIHKTRGRYNWNLLLKTKDPYKTGEFLRDILGRFGRHKGGIITVDVDPITL